MSVPVALILGAGANIGQGVARALAAKGYKIALASRSMREQDSTPDEFHVAGDFSNPDSIADIFEKVKAKLGLPHVVIYNAAALSPRPPTDALSVPLAAFTRDLTINTISAFAAIQQAALAFGELPSSASRTFIYTGNCLNTVVMPAIMTLGVGKSATAHVIECAAESYKSKGFKFYYTDERNPDGSPVDSAISGEAAAAFYPTLVETTEQGPWDQTFVKGLGHKKF